MFYYLDFFAFNATTAQPIANIATTAATTGVESAVCGADGVAGAAVAAGAAGAAGAAALPALTVTAAFVPSNVTTTVEPSVSTVTEAFDPPLEASPLKERVDDNKRLRKNQNVKDG